MSTAPNIESGILEVAKVRSEFPVLDQLVNGHPLVYLDNAATTQKPQSVIDALDSYYKGYNANIHRGIHTLAEKATLAFEDTRKSLQQFVGAEKQEEIIFTKGTTEGINLVASTYGRQNVSEGDEIIISGMEHHSNIVPWQLLCEEKNARLKVIPLNESGEIILEEYEKLLSEKTKIVSVCYASNSLGTINPVEEIIRLARQYNAVVVIDGAQAAPHLNINVQTLDCDFFAFSGHKMYGPTGVGALYGKSTLLETMPPYQGGGEMIRDVTFDKTTFNDIPYKFEAGTPNIGDVIAFKAAVDFIHDLGKEAIAHHEQELLHYANERLLGIDGFKPVGTAKEKVSVVSFLMEGVHSFDVGQLLDARGIAVRTGHHCTQPLMDFFKIDGTVRASFAVYNTKEEIDILTEALEKVAEFGRR